MIVLHYATATPYKVIEYAATYLPATLALEMERLSLLHHTAGNEMRDRMARDAAYKLSLACDLCAEILRSGERPEDKALAITAEVRTLVPCFDAACDMLRIPRQERSSIMSRHA